MAVSNPQRISVNGVIIELLGADLFTDMENAMISRPKGAGTQDLIIQSMLEQGSLYPVFPPATSDFPIEYKYEDQFLLDDVPDVLLVQSTQPCFVKV